MNIEAYFSWRRSMVGLIVLLIILTTGCEKDDKPGIKKQETGTVTDIDGNVYRTVKIGNQWWMAENLRVSRYLDGSFIPDVQSATSWATASYASCRYENLDLAPGRLYNWYVVSHGAGLAPEGWHIPTDADWSELEKYLGMSDTEIGSSGWRGDDQGEKLKMEGLSGWALYDGVWATNESGFAAEAGSCRLFDGKFGNPGLKYNGFWWSATESDSAESWYRHLDYKEKRVFRYFGSKKYGFSVRCVKNS